MSDLPRIAVSLNGEKVYFEDRNSVDEFCFSQEQNWKWLTKLPHKYRDVGVSIYKMFFADPLSEMQATLADGARTRLELGSEKMPFITFDSDEGYLIDKVKREYGAVTAVLSLIYLNMGTRNAIVKDSKIKVMVDDPDLYFERSVAIQIGLSHQNFIPLISDARSSAVRDTLEKFISQAELASDAVDGYVSDIASRMQSSDAILNKYTSTIVQSYDRRKKVYIKYAGRLRLAAKQTIQDATDALASAKAAYHDQVDLDSSVQYWTVRRKEHAFFKVIWFFAVLVSMVATFLSMVGYYGLGGAIGLAHVLSGLRSVPVESVPTSPSTPASLVMGHAPSEISVAVADLAGAALLITLMGVIVRIALRQFNTHSHLTLEASERITFTKTYLALLNEGKLKSDEDRKLILESLFRSTQSGAVAEIPFSSPVELIIKTLSDKKPV